MSGASGSRREVAGQLAGGFRSIGAMDGAIVQFV
jgi:hypothetical protein